jgi:hypothetical protein
MTKKGEGRGEGEGNVSADLTRCGLQGTGCGLRGTGYEKNNIIDYRLIIQLSSYPITFNDGRRPNDQ